MDGGVYPVPGGLESRSNGGEKCSLSYLPRQGPWYRLMTLSAEHSTSPIVLLLRVIRGRSIAFLVAVDLAPHANVAREEFPQQLSRPGAQELTLWAAFLYDERVPRSIAIFRIRGGRGGASDGR